MNENRLSTIFWGGALLLAGLVLLASNLNILPNWSNNPSFWIVFFLGVSLLFFATFAYSAITNHARDWGLLFPACIAAGLAGTIFLAESNRVDDARVAFPILFGTALPFLLGFLLNPAARRGLLIPFWAIGALAGLMLFVDRVPDEVIPLYVMMAIAIPFWLVAFTNRENTWAFIPAGIITMIGIIPILTTLGDENMIGAVIMAFFALPFVIVALYSAKNWWAQIPAGIFLSIALVVALAAQPWAVQEKSGLLAAILLAGFALTFGLLWLRRASVPTDWAKYPAIALLVLAFLGLVIGLDGLNMLFPVLLILGGWFVIMRALRKPKQPE